jgi:hypothetical protein
VRITVRDAQGEVLDEWRREVHVPQDGHVTARVGTPLTYRANIRSAEQPRPPGEGAVPTADRRFRRTDRVIVTLPVASASPPSGVRADLVNGRGQTLLVLPVARHADRTWRLELPLPSLAPASYVLRLVATFDDTTVSRVLPFVLVP